MRINKAIRADKVRVIGSDGKQVGVLPIGEALALAEDEKLDLIEISPAATPPVCKIMDYGKYKYRQTKKEKDAKKTQHQVKVKEIKLKPNIDNHDFQTKLKQAREFIRKGKKVRVTCFFRGRQLLHVELGEKLLERMCEGLQDVATVEAPFKRMGKSITLVLAPSSKKAIKPTAKSAVSTEK